MAARQRITLHERARRRGGYTVTELARAAGFSHAYVSRVEGGDLVPSPKYRAAVAQVLGVPEHAIFGVARSTDRTPEAAVT